MDRNIKQFLKIYPWFSGLTGDLLFYIAIDTLFLTVVKNFSAAQVVSLTSVSTIACIVLQFPMLGVIRKLGNTVSMRIATVLMLLSALLITFGPNYYVVVLGRLLHDVSVIFRSTLFVTLENNLELVDKRQEFISMRTKGNTVYAVITMLISFVASLMFNLHHYLPMIGCIAVCAICCVLSFFMADYSPYNKINRKKKVDRKKLSYSGVLVLIICAYGLFFGLVACAQPDGKLFIQQQLMLEFDVEKTALVIGAILCVSRVIRVLSNVVFAGIYRQHGEKVGIFLPTMMFVSLVLIILGSFIPVIVLKIAVMSIGYVILLFIRDPFRLYIQDVVLDNTAKEDHQTVLTVLEFSVRICKAAMGLAFTFVLLKFPLIVEIGIMAAIAAVGVILNLRLYRMIMDAKKVCS